MFMISLKQAQYFLEIIHCGSITEASRKLFVSQPALSQTMKNMEQELQFSLFVRGSSPLQLTKLGKEMIPIARSIVTFNQNIEDYIKSLQELPTHSFRFGVLSGQAQDVVSHVLPSFINTHPQVEVSIAEAGSHDIERMLMDGKIDIGILSGAQTNSSFHYIELRKDTMVVLAPKYSAFARNHPDRALINFDELHDQHFVIKPTGSYSRILLDTLSHLYGIPLKIKYEFENLAPIAPVFPTLGCVTFLPKSYYLATPDLYETSNLYYINCPEIHYHEYLCYHKNLFLSDYLEDFIAAARDYLSGVNQEHNIDEP